MLWNEFIEGTGCKDNEYNYQVYKNLEIMYMNSDMSKTEIYEYGKKLVDNSKTEAELRLEAEIKKEIESCKALIESHKSWVNYHKVQKEVCKMDSTEDGKYWVKEHGRMEKYYRNEIKSLRNKIIALKWTLEA